MKQFWWRALLWALMAQATAVQAQVLDDISYNGADNNRFTLSFSSPVRYKRHFPQTATETVVVDVCVISGLDCAKPRITERITRRAAGTGVPLRDLVFEGNGAEGARLVLRFSEPVKVRVTQGGNVWSMDFIVERPQAPTDTGQQYVVNLDSSQKPITGMRPLPASLRKRVYFTVEHVQRDDRWYDLKWYRLRTGFFNTSAEAKRMRRQLLPYYPAAWVDVATARDQVAAGSRRLIPPLLKVAPAVPKPVAPKAPAAAVPRTAGEMLEAGKRALWDGKNNIALGWLSKVLRQPDARYHQEAHELLGLAYERLGQKQRAVVEYKLYLKTYAKSDGAQRVSQRLAALTRSDTTRKLRDARRKDRSGWDHYGTWSQTYYRGNSKVDTTTISGPVVTEQPTFTDVDQSTLVSTFDSTSRWHRDRLDFRAVVSADHSQDFLNDEGEGRVRRLYGELRDRGLNYHVKLGRQSSRGAGVLSRFDGIQAGYRPWAKWGFSVVAGMPVDDFAEDTDRRFAGASLDMGTFAGAWSGSLYYLRQEADDFIDREALGVEMRYFKDAFSMFGVVDYDLHFGDLNAVLIQGNVIKPDQSSYNFLLDYRNNPFVQLSNALLGATTESLSALVTEQGLAGTEALAQDRTTRSSLVSVGVTKPITKESQYGIDFMIINVSGMPASGAAGTLAGEQLAVEGTGNVYTLTGRLIGNNMLLDRDIIVMGASYSDSETFSASSVFLTDRMNLAKAWRLDLGLKYYEQDTPATGVQLIRTTPSLKLSWQWTREWSFNLEMAREISQTESATSEEQTERDFYSLGYRWDF